MPPEVQDVINKAQEMTNKIKEKKEKFDENIGEIMSKLDNLEVEYADRSKEFIESKREELIGELETKKKLVEKEIDRLTNQAQDWLDKKKNDLIKKAADLTLKILTGMQTPDFDDNK